MKRKFDIRAAGTELLTRQTTGHVWKGNQLKSQGTLAKTDPTKCSWCKNSYRKYIFSFTKEKKYI